MKKKRKISLSLQSAHFFFSSVLMNMPRVYKKNDADGDDEDETDDNDYAEKKRIRVHISYIMRIAENIRVLVYPFFMYT